MYRSPLQRAITRGMKPGADLADELQELGDYPIQSRRDAKTICRALVTLPLPRSDEYTVISPLHALTGLFQDVDGREAPAFDVLQNEGVSQLVRIFDALTGSPNDEDKNDLLFMLKIMAMYGSREGAETVVRAAQMPLDPDGYMWHVVLGMFTERHPERDFVFEALRDPLPSGFIAMSLLDVVNEQAIDGSWDDHLFDSLTGKEQLHSWLADNDPENYSYAHSATAALPFISNPERDQLLALAMDHADTSVQMEAAWASGKLGSEAGMKVLGRFCLDINHSSVAARYLAELDREDMIPDEALDDTFQAKAEFVQWLSHPSELGEPPDEVEVVDQRVLAWPPDGERKPFWLIKYRNRDETGLDEDDTDCGLVGSVTWCFFTYDLDQRPPEDAYAIHCYFELEHKDLINELDVEDPREYASMLGQWQGDELADATIEVVTEVSPKLNYPQRLVGLASARQGGEEGWAVLDGPRSAWYPKSDMPEDSPVRPILMAHVGRRLLGFAEQPNRKKYLHVKTPPRDAQLVVDKYEENLTKLEQGDERAHEKLFDSFGNPVTSHLNSYVEAKALLDGVSKEEVFVRMYERFLNFANSGSDDLKQEAFDSPSNLLGSNFEQYVDALASTNQLEKVPAAIAIFEPWWDHVFGYTELGTAAFRAGDFETAERFFNGVRSEMGQWYRSETMSYLAEIWLQRGDREVAHELLIECLRKTNAGSKEAKGSDIEFFEEKFQFHRETYLRLFPDRGEPALAENGVPASTFPQCPNPNDQ